MLPAEKKCDYNCLPLFENIVSDAVLYNLIISQHAHYNLSEIIACISYYIKILCDAKAKRTMTNNNPWVLYNIVHSNKLFR